MSMAPEDIKTFDVLSGQVTVADVGGRNTIIANAKAGEWRAFVDYDDDNMILHMAACCADELVDGLDSFRIKSPVSIERRVISSESGIISMFDRHMHGHWPRGYELPDSMKNAELTDALGEPDAPGKSDARKFAELCSHLGRFSNGRSQMPRIESAGYGVAFDMGCGDVQVNLIMNEMRDMVGVEVVRPKA